MNISILVFVVGVCICLQLSTAKSYLEEYCWRDYEGTTPRDAFLAGTDLSGKRIYIGQALFEDKLEPGKIYENEAKIYFEMGHKEIVLQENIKILCTEAPIKFKWVPANKDNVTTMVNQILIKGGFEPTYYIYIGRVKTDAFFGVGKVVCRDTCLPMFTTDKGEAKEFDEFEVLTYSRSS